MVACLGSLENFSVESCGGGVWWDELWGGWYLKPSKFSSLCGQ